MLDAARTVINTNESLWMDNVPITGTKCLPLEDNFNTYLIQFQPNFALPLHTHHGGEEFFVLENSWSPSDSGSLIDVNCEYKKGFYVRQPHESSHEPFTAQTQGCSLFVKVQHMVDKSEPVLVVDTGIYGGYCTNFGNCESTSSNGHPVLRGEWYRVTDTKYVMNLYHSEQTNETVWLEKWSPGHVETRFEPEEIFILQGDVIELRNTASNETSTNTFPQNYWIRTPGNEISQIKQRHTQSGCVFYKKTGLVH
jgi:hypothetical protein